MLSVHYIGGNTVSLGAALVGARVHSPAPDAATILDVLQAARNAADLVLIEEELAFIVGKDLDDLVNEHAYPPILVLPGDIQTDAHRSETVRGTIERARAILGMTT